KKTPEGAEVFKSAGNLLIKVERNETLEELEDKVETLKLRQQTMTRQEERVMKKLEEMQATIQQAMGGLQG
ncbi:MAG: prefoldin subunit beta, partial [Methanobrevibacter sp.]|nr:prefoldin subunit beta [Methanobrevibacter sp.]